VVRHACRTDIGWENLLPNLTHWERLNKNSVIHDSRLPTASEIISFKFYRNLLVFSNMWTQSRDHLSEVFNHISGFENHFPDLGVKAVAFEQHLRTFELRRHWPGEVKSEGVSAPVERPVAGRRRPVVDVLVVVIGPPGRMAASIVADHLQPRLDQHQVRVTLQDAVRLPQTVKRMQVIQKPLHRFLHSPRNHVSHRNLAACSVSTRAGALFDTTVGPWPYFFLAMKTVFYKRALKSWWLSQLTPRPQNKKNKEEIKNKH